MPAYWKLLSQIGSWRCDWRIDMTSQIAIAISFVFDIIPKFQIRRGYPMLSYWQVLICPKTWRSLPSPGYSVWNPYGIHGIHQKFHMESMEWMLAETPANFFFHGQHGIHVEWWWNGHGMINSIWNSHGFHWIPYGMQTSPCGFHGTSPYGFHGTNPHGFHDHCTIRIHINSTRNHWIVTE